MLGNYSYYGNYRTRTFFDIYSEASDFISDYNSLFPGTMTDQELTRAYYLILSQFKNSHIANSDENQFRMRCCSILFANGPTWSKKLDIQLKLRNLTEEEIMTGSVAIYNHSNNPSTLPGTATLKELPTIDDQNTQHFIKSKLEAYSVLWNVLATDITSEFVAKFAKLFIKIAQPDAPLWYANEKEED